MGEPRRIAFAGDWHGNGRWAVAAIEHAAQLGAGVIVHAGDFGYEFRAAYVRDLTRALTRLGLHLWFVDGNHEDFSLLRLYPVRESGLREVSERIWHVPRGHRWTWSGTTFLGCGGAHSVDRQWREPGTSWWREETITDADATRCTTGGPVDVLVSHDCPAGVPIPGLAEPAAPRFPPEDLALANEHRRRLRRIVDTCRPRTIVHGHYHVAYETTAHALGYPARVIGLDCDGTALDRNVRLLDLTGRPA
jgi:hypothetical protein